MTKRFIPLEGNPEVFTNLAHKLGMSTALAFHDVYSVDEPDLLAMIPRPVYALIMTFPVTERYEQFRIDADKDLKDDYYEEFSGKGSEEALWFRQTIRNACGTMGLLHALTNGLPNEFIVPGSELDSIIKKAEPLGVADRSQSLEDSRELESCHAAAASTGDTAPPQLHEEVEHHFVCLARGRKNPDKLYELDGRRKGPVDLGKLDSSVDMLSQIPLQKCQEFLKREGESGHFSILALAPTVD